MRAASAARLLLLARPPCAARRFAAAATAPAPEAAAAPPPLPPTLRELLPPRIKRGSPRRKTPAPTQESGSARPEDVSAARAATCRLWGRSSPGPSRGGRLRSPPPTLPPPPPPPRRAPLALQCPFVATYKVLRATNIAPPGTKLADVKVLGRPLRPDLAGGVAARAPRSAGVWDSTTSGGSGDSASSAGSASSSGPSSSGSDTAGSASEGESAAASSALLAPGGLRAPADDAGDASSSGSGSEPTAAAAATRAAGAAPAKAAGRLFAVIPLGGTQYKVTPGDLINAERIPTAVVGGSLEVDTVHVVGSAGWTVLGRPAVPGARVTLRVEEQALDRKVIVYKKNRRKRYQRTRGHRRLVTRLRVEAVDYDGGDLVPVAA